MTGNEDATEKHTGHWYWVDLETQPIYYIQCDHEDGLVILEENFYKEAVSGHSHPRKKALIDCFGDEELKLILSKHTVFN